jgi:hypothetical protein
MCPQVQDAIQHNKRVFEQRVLSEDMHIKKKVFHGWRAARYGTLAKQQVRAHQLPRCPRNPNSCSSPPAIPPSSAHMQLLQRVLARMMRSRLAKAFFAWKDKFGLVDKNFAMRRKLQATISKGRLRRAFLGWRKQCKDRWWVLLAAMP